MLVACRRARRQRRPAACWLLPAAQLIPQLAPLPPLRASLQGGRGRCAAAQLCGPPGRRARQPGGGAAAQVRRAPGGQAQVRGGRQAACCEALWRSALRCGSLAGCPPASCRVPPACLHTRLCLPCPAGAARSAWRAAGAAAPASSLTRPRSRSAACCRWAAGGRHALVGGVLACRARRSRRRARPPGRCGSGARAPPLRTLGPAPPALAAGVCFCRRRGRGGAHPARPGGALLPPRARQAGGCWVQAGRAGRVSGVIMGAAGGALLPPRARRAGGCCGAELGSKVGGRRCGCAPSRRPGGRSSSPGTDSLHHTTHPPTCPAGAAAGHGRAQPGAVAGAAGQAGGDGRGVDLADVQGTRWLACRAAGCWLAGCCHGWLSVLCPRGQATLLARCQLPGRRQPGHALSWRRDPASLPCCRASSAWPTTWRT